MRKNKFDGMEGLSFGITSGTITMLGVLIGLAATGNRSFALIGVLIVGVADALSDAAGMYVSEESEYVHSHKEIWKSAVYTFLGKITMAICLLLPLLVFTLTFAVGISISIGMTAIILLGYFVAKGHKKLGTFETISKYVFIVILVASISYLLGIVMSGLLI